LQGFGRRVRCRELVDAKGPDDQPASLKPMPGSYQTNMNIYELGASPFIFFSPKVRRGSRANCRRAFSMRAYFNGSESMVAW
jgi:hypothetical protein